MSTLREIVYNSVINLHRKTKKEWISLKEIYNEVDRVRDVGINNGGASVRAALETHSSLSKVFSGKEEYILKEKGSGLYKSVYYDQIMAIENLSIGDTFSREELMKIFKISGQSGIMPTKTLNCLVLITSEENGIYNDGMLRDGLINYTGDGLIGDQILGANNNNRKIFDSRKNELPMYLFTKDRNKLYTFEGKVELYDEPYQTNEKDKEGKDRLVWKFPLKVIYMENSDYSEDKNVKVVAQEIEKIENNIKIDSKSEEIEIKNGPLKLRKYRKTGNHRQRKNKPDFIAQEIIKTKQGKINEKTIYNHEVKNLMNQNAKEQVKRMKEFFENKKENEGFDILSFELNKDGEYIEKYIEVKSTKGNEGVPIDITADEIEFAKEHINNYYLYRIINSDSCDRYLKIVKGIDLLNESNFNFIPTAFKIYSR